MKKILTNSLSRFKGKPVTFNMVDYAISSHNLGVSVEELKIFVSQLVEIDDTEYPKVIGQKADITNLNNLYISFMSGMMLIFWEGSLNWEALTKFYILSNSLNKNPIILERINDYLSNIKFSLVSYKQKVNEIKKAMVDFRNDLNKSIPFFNIPELMKACKLNKVTVKTDKDKVVLFFNNVTLKNKDVSVQYKQIILFIKDDFTLDGFLLRFDKFDYSSYWKMPHYLHPYLDTPYCFNQALAWLPNQDYNSLVIFLKDLVTNFNDGGFISLEDISKELERLSELWNKNQYTNKLEGSKSLFLLTKN